MLKGQHHCHSAPLPCLPSAASTGKDEVIRPGSFTSRGQRPSRGPGVRRGEAGIAQEDHSVGTEGKGLPQGGFGLGRPHRQGDHFASLGRTDCQSLLEGVEVQGIDHGPRSLPDHRPRNLIHTNIVGIGDLFNKYCDLHWVTSFKIFGSL